MAMIFLWLQLKELDELKTKLRVLESQRTEDRNRMKDLEKSVQDAEEIQAAKQKLSGVLQLGLLIH